MSATTDCPLCRDEPIVRYPPIADIRLKSVNNPPRSQQASCNLVGSHVLWAGPQCCEVIMVEYKVRARYDLWRGVWRVVKSNVPGLFAEKPTRTEFEMSVPR